MLAKGSVKEQANWLWPSLQFHHFSNDSTLRTLSRTACTLEVRTLNHAGCSIATFFIFTWRKFSGICARASSAARSRWFLSLYLLFSEAPSRVPNGFSMIRSGRSSLDAMPSISASLICPLPDNPTASIRFLSAYNDRSPSTINAVSPSRALQDSAKRQSNSMLVPVLAQHRQ